MQPLHVPAPPTSAGDGGTSSCRKKKTTSHTTSTASPSCSPSYTCPPAVPFNPCSFVAFSSQNPVPAVPPPQPHPPTTTACCLLPASPAADAGGIGRRREESTTFRTTTTGSHNCAQDSMHACMAHGQHRSFCNPGTRPVQVSCGFLQSSSRGHVPCITHG